MALFDTASLPGPGQTFAEPVRIYTGMLGQIGDIIMFGATARRIKEIFPASQITFAVSAKYREAGLLLAGLPYIDRLFVTELYFENLRDLKYGPWLLGWPVDLRGEDEVAEQRHYDIVLETRPRHRRMPWWEYGHLIEAMAHMVGVPGPIDLRTEICIPPGTQIPPEAVGRIVLHNDSTIDSRNNWPWHCAAEFIGKAGPENVVLLGSPGPAVPGAIDLRGKTSLLQAAAIIAAARCFVGINSGPIFIAGSLQVPVVGLYGTEYLPSAAWPALQPANPRAIYLCVEGSLGSIPADAVLTGLKQAEALSQAAGNH